MQKALLNALVTPHQDMADMQDKADFTSLIVMHEELKSYPFSDVWEYFLEQNGVDSKFLCKVREYEEAVLFKRV
jgi:L-rhamnose isomerase